MARLILASGSPRRKALLEELGLQPNVHRPYVDETVAEGTPREQVLFLAKTKADAVAASVWSGWVVGADTMGSLDGEPLGQPADEAEARRTLRRLSGRAHEVFTGVCVVRVEDGVSVDRAEDVARTTVHFHRLSDATIDAYVATGEPLGKAGAYGIQGKAGAFVARIEGSYPNVVGLPVDLTLRLLHHLDFPLPGHLHLA